MGEERRRIEGETERKERNGWGVTKKEKDERMKGRKGRRKDANAETDKRQRKREEKNTYNQRTRKKEQKK